MKRALVLSLAVIVGLGIGAFAQLSGSWSSTLSFNLGATTFTDYIVDLTSTFEMNYALAGWTFGSVSDFDLTGFSGQSFSVDGSLGAFGFTSTAAFAPMVVTKYTTTLPANLGALTQTPSATLALCDSLVPVVTAFTPGFLTLTAEGSVSIAGATVGAYVYMDQSNVPVQYVGYALQLDGKTQTDSWVLPSYNNGTGAKITIAGAIGGMDITSYTYFNLSELDAKTTYCPAIGKRGVFSIVEPGCGVAFNEEYLMFEGITFGCVEFSTAVKFTCAGFNSLKLVANGIDIGGWATFNVGINFTTTSKAIDLCMTLNKLAFSCVAAEIGFNDNGYAESGTAGPLKIENIQIHGFSFTTTVGSVTFTGKTELDATSKLFSSATDWMYLNGDVQKSFLIPWAGISVIVPGEDAYCENGTDYAATDTKYQYVQSGAGYYELICGPESRYRLWEMFSISIDEDACCGGLFGIDINTYFGQKQKLSYFAYDILSAVDGKPGAVTYLYGSAGFTPSKAATTPLCTDVVTYGWGYVDDTSVVQLFNWAYTTVDFSVGIGSNLTLNVGAGISAYGWESLDLGFEFTW